MKGEYVIGKTLPRQRLVRARLAFDLPANPKQCSEHPPCFRGRPTTHRGGLSGAKGNADEIRAGFSMLQPVGEYSQGQRFSPGDSLVTRVSIGENTSEIANLRD